MKQLIKMCLLFAVAMAMFACTGGNTPSAVAEKSVKCIINDDYEGYVDMMYFDAKITADKEQFEQQKKQWAAMLKEKVTKSMEKNGKKMKSGKAVSEEISEDGDRATVVMTVKYDDGTEATDNVKLRKDKDGNWKLDAGK